MTNESQQREDRASGKKSGLFGWIPKGLTCLLIVGALFGYIGYRMGAAPMLNTVMHTAHDLLLNTCFYLMAICVLTGALGKVFVEFGVVDLIEKILRPLMKPVFNLPGVASLGAVLTFLSDNPAIITLAKDTHFSGYFKKFQYISLTNFGTAFGMGLIVIVFMMGQGYMMEPLIGFLGACTGCVVSTRCMQYFVLKAYPAYREENALDSQKFKEMPEKVIHEEEKSTFLRTLNSLLDGGKSGVEVGMSIIPGVLIISTLVMILTFGASKDGTFTGAAYEGIELLRPTSQYMNQLSPGHAVVPERSSPDRLPHHRSWCCGRCAKLDSQLRSPGLDRRQRHRCLHRHRYVLVGLPQYPYSHARRHWLS